MAALSLCFRLHLGPGLPDSPPLRFQGCRSVLGPSESQLQCHGQGEPALFN